MESETGINQISEQLLLAVKMGESTEVLVAQLAKLSLDQLQKELETDGHKKAFWINCYNAFFQIIRKVKKLDKPSIYTNKEITIAGKLLSLDDIEHGILRKYRYKKSLGYLPNIFAPAFIKALAVDVIDYRIHFALNCGAKSCPPIAFYAAEKIEIQLEMATLSFLESDTEVNNAKKEIHVTSLMLWFKADFEGEKGIKRILEEKLKIEIQDYKLVYKPYSWEEALDNYAA